MHPEIELYRAVQKHREPWKFGDLLIHDEYGLAVVIGVSGRTIEVEFEGARGRRTLLADDKHITWLPPTAPRWPGDDEKRTLWGMVDWENIWPYVRSDGKMTIYRTGRPGVTIVNGPLPEALLRAIEQKGE